MGSNASILQCFPGNLQEKSLLRVHMNSFTRRNPEEVGIKEIYVGQKSTPPTWHFADCRRIGIVETFSVPAFCRNINKCLNLILEQLPECLRMTGTWQTATQTNNGNRL